MESWKIEPSKQTPLLCFNADEHTFTMKGECYPENIAEFSALIFSWLTAYLQQLGNETLTINIELIYFNSSSSKMLLDLFDKLEEQVSEKNKSIVVNWIYDAENDTAQEYGEEFKEDLEALIFNLVQKMT